ncbi:hypothetical protein [Prevotella dentasini]|uniref:hypothetical protein n=1 Tax=Prevotella dentasini TaxID=589537 RepID=UPI0011DD4D06|nr:hypothetical protein [Prevotella dentasini]
MALFFCTGLSAASDFLLVGLAGLAWEWDAMAAIRQMLKLPRTAEYRQQIVWRGIWGDKRCMFLYKYGCRCPAFLFCGSNKVHFLSLFMYLCKSVFPFSDKNVSV